MKKVLFGFCESTQDVVFLYRIFSAAGFKSFNKKIADSFCVFCVFCGLK